MKKLSKTLCILITLALPAGCINEDMSDCPPPYNTELTFSYSGDRQEPAMFSRMIVGVTLVVFDRAGGERVLDKTVVQADLNRFQGTELYLPAGDYRIVCWGNAFETRSCFRAVSPKAACMRLPTVRAKKSPPTTTSITVSAT